MLHGQINRGWQAHYHWPVEFTGIMLPLTLGNLNDGFEDCEFMWMHETARFYLRAMSADEREKNGITMELAKK
jgi:hypothetical protein